MSFRYQPGDRPLEGYTIQRGVGRGGFGEVFYALSDGGREVALKTVFYNEEIELRGVRHCINLKSPHLVSIFDVRKGADGTPFVIMEYVTGPSIRDLLSEHPNGLGTQKAGFLACEMAKGLVYLHERGIVHRDLKPENIFYEEGYVKIGDYGLSKVINASHQSGQTMSVGTVHYMAPEIGSGNYDRSIDIYALGVILYELLTGSVPFMGDSFGEVLMKHLTAKPDLSKIDEPFRSAIDGALQKKPKDRFASADEMANRLFENEALNSSVSVFNPESLSQAAAKKRRAPEAMLGGAPAASPVVPPPPSLPAIEEPQRAPTPQPTAAEPSLAESERVRSERPATPRIRPTAAAVEAMDPIERPQRLLRVFFLAILGITIARVVLLFRGEQLLGFILCALAGAGSVTLTHYKLGPMFQVAPGFGFRILAAAVGALPIFVGSPAVAGPHLGVRAGWAVVLSMALIFWQQRTSPLRRERINLIHAMTAGFCGFGLGLLFRAPPLATGAITALMSLFVGAYLPFIPHERRPHWRKVLEGEEPPPPTGPPVSEKARTFVEAAAGRTANAGEVIAARSRTDRLARQAFPGLLTRFVWVSFACAMSAGAVSCLVGAFIVPLPDDELFVLIAGGEGLLGAAGFSLYRGLWAQRLSFWERTLSPFLLFSCFTGAVISSTLLVMGPVFEVWRFQDEATLAALAVLIGSTFFFGSLRRLS